jgi:hypothetical protein
MGRTPCHLEERNTMDVRKERVMTAGNAIKTAAVIIMFTAFMCCLPLFIPGSRCPESLPQERLPSVQDPARVDRSLLTGVPCEPPCWQELIPGESTVEDVLEVLENAPFVDVASIQRTSFDERETIEWQSSVSERASWETSPIGVVELSEGRVSSILVNLEYELGLQELVGLMGEPAGYFVFSHDSPAGPVCYTYSVGFVWPENGLVAMSFLDVPNPIPQHEQLLPPDALYVTRVHYYPPAVSLREFMVTAQGMGEEYYQTYWAPHYQDWSGIDSITMP